MDVVKSVVILKDIQGQVVRPLPFRLQGRGYRDRPHAECHDTLHKPPCSMGHETSARPKYEAQRTGDAPACHELDHEASCQETEDGTGAEKIRETPWGGSSRKRGI